jgi:hypothetical protein
LDAIVSADSPTTFQKTALKGGVESEIEIYGPQHRFAEGTIGIEIARSILSKKKINVPQISMQETVLNYAVKTGNRLTFIWTLY